MVEDEVVNSVTVPVDMNLSIFQEIIEDREPGILPSLSCKLDTTW